MDKIEKNFPVIYLYIANATMRTEKKEKNKVNRLTSRIDLTQINFVELAAS